MAETVFWATVFLVCYTYAGYSLIVVLLAAFSRQRAPRRDIEPTVTFLITAYNEERNIAQKLRNTLELDYPREKLEIIVASDGSTDRTDEIVRGFVAHGLISFRV